MLFLGYFNKKEFRSQEPEFIPFWILDFGFWIVKHPLDKCFSFPSVAIIFQIGFSMNSELKSGLRHERSVER
ncbi:hypothetical protein A6769_14155 [Nostoc punctiforme NIES-2108]|uniref:Uncharacterized protein n=1 Tax=Nostoc punctiforme NIES-2108 TaxID=1356359 RepID=A0A367RKX6_NOSPU|nr:hypothetical protein A6769_14155 [Nostoc punctiforme NIES-2108]